jgi:hypothetical protein
MGHCLFVGTFIAGQGGLRVLTRSVFSASVCIYLHGFYFLLKFGDYYQTVVFCSIGKHVPWRIINRSEKWKMEGSSSAGLLPTPARPVFQHVPE